MIVQQEIVVCRDSDLKTFHSTLSHIAVPAFMSKDRFGWRGRSRGGGRGRGVDLTPETEEVLPKLQ